MTTDAWQSDGSLRPVSSLNFWQRTRAAQIHGLGMLIAVVTGIGLINGIWDRPVVERWVLFPYIFGSAVLFGISTLYHFWHDGHGMPHRVSDLFEKLDHATIYVFIAACYTILFYYTLDPIWAGRLIAASWIYVAFGLFYTFFKVRLPILLQHRYFYTATFVLLGWIVLLRLPSVVQGLSQTQLMLFLAGGSAYTLGALVYALRWEIFRGSTFGYHEIWHALVVAGWLAHQLMIRSLLGHTPF